VGGWISPLWAQVDAGGQPTNTQAGTATDSLRTLQQAATDTTREADSLSKVRVLQADSLLLDSLEQNATLKASVRYEAADSVVFDFSSQRLLLYEQSKVDYTDMSLSAKRIQIDMAQKTMAAQGVADSLGQLQGTPTFVQGEDKYETESIRYNYATEKGQVTYAYTTQNNEQILGERARRNPDKTFYIENGRFTTCTHPHPHFYIGARRLKMIPNDRIISGPLFLSIADVPLPILLPFGFFPFQKSRSSGLLFPEFGEARDRGYFLRNLGFYWAASEYWDLAILGDIYSRGGYRINPRMNYRKRYGFNGSFSFEYSQISVNFPEDEGFADPAFNYRQETNFFVDWTHSQTLTPQSSLNANVHAGSSNYLRRNGFGQDILRNDLRSSISYQTRFPRLKASLTANLDHQQNLNAVQDPTFGLARMLSLTLPRVAFNKDRMYPFRPLVGAASRRWYENIGITYNAEVQNQLRIPDSLLFTPEAFDRLNSGMVQRVGINTNLKLLQYFNLTPSLNYNEYWYLEEVQRRHIARGEKQLDSLATKQVQNGFQRGGDWSLSLNLTTNVYGTSRKFGRNQLQVRHVLQPNLGYTYRPDFSQTQSYRTITSTDSLMTQLTYSRFEGLLYGGPPRGEQQQLSLSLNNLWEAKYYARDAKVDSLTGKRQYTYLKLIDNLGLAGNYNFAADSFQLSLINASLRTVLYRDLLNLNVSANYDPYDFVTTVNETTRVASYRRLNEFGVKNGKLLRLVNASFALGATVRRGQFDSDSRKDNQARRAARLSPAQQAYRSLYQPINFDWRFGANYTLNYSRPFDVATEQIRHSLNLTAGLKPTPNWDLSLNTNYDLENEEFAFTQVNISRDLHCWQMTLSWIPIGIRQSYLITLNVKASTLKDLKITKRRDWRDTFIDIP
jgi:lipopolysaccharide assembly outer membrane protein LptD (OstA)